MSKSLAVVFGFGALAADHGCGGAGERADFSRSRYQNRRRLSAGRTDRHGGAAGTTSGSRRGSLGQSVIIENIAGAGGRMGIA